MHVCMYVCAYLILDPKVLANPHLYERCVKYCELMDKKKFLKKMLKKYDDDFLAKKGRAPRKMDKEVMRPQYQTYHEVGEGEVFERITFISFCLSYNRNAMA